MISCGNKEFRSLHVTKKVKGNTNCIEHLRSENKSICKFIEHQESIILLKHSDYWSEIDENQINKKHRIPERYSHQYELKKEEWLNFEFYLLSDDKCNCDVRLNYYNNIREKLLIYEDLIIDTIKRNYIKEIGKSKFNNNYRLIIFGENDNAENITISENRVSIPKLALDWKFQKYGFLITSTAKKEDPLIYFNKAILIDLNSLKILSEIEPII